MKLSPRSRVTTNVCAAITRHGEQRVKPILAIVEQLGGLGTTSVIRTMARRQDISPLMTEECLFWLEKHGRVVRELGVWRAVRGG
jgi:hypothetical protein